MAFTHKLFSQSADKFQFSSLLCCRASVFISAFIFTFFRLSRRRRCRDCSGAAHSVPHSKCPASNKTVFSRASNG